MWQAKKEFHRFSPAAAAQLQATILKSLLLLFICNNAYADFTATAQKINVCSGFPDPKFFSVGVFQAPTTIHLSDIAPGIVPGTTLKFKQVGLMKFNPDMAPSAPGFATVFLGAGGAHLASGGTGIATPMPGSLFGEQAFSTAPTGSTAEVPAGATSLQMMVIDSYYPDNSDAGGFGATVGILCVPEDAPAFSLPVTAAPGAVSAVYSTSTNTANAAAGNIPDSDSGISGTVTAPAVLPGAVAKPEVSSAGTASEEFTYAAAANSAKAATTAPAAVGLVSSSSESSGSSSLSSAVTSSSSDAKAASSAQSKPLSAGKDGSAVGSASAGAMALAAALEISNGNPAPKLNGPNSINLVDENSRAARSKDTENPMPTLGNAGGLRRSPAPLGKGSKMDLTSGLADVQDNRNSNPFAYLQKDSPTAPQGPALFERIASQYRKRMGTFRKP